MRYIHYVRAGYPASFWHLWAANYPSTRVFSFMLVHTVIVLVFSSSRWTIRSDRDRPPSVSRPCEISAMTCVTRVRRLEGCVIGRTEKHWYKSWHNYQALVVECQPWIISSLKLVAVLYSLDEMGQTVTLCNGIKAVIDQDAVLFKRLCYGSDLLCCAAHRLHVSLSPAAW